MEQPDWLSWSEGIRVSPLNISKELSHRVLWVSVCDIHPYNEGCDIVLLLERGEFHTRAWARGGISAYSQCRGVEQGGVTGWRTPLCTVLYRGDIFLPCSASLSAFSFSAMST